VVNALQRQVFARNRDIQGTEDDPKERLAHNRDLQKTESDLKGTNTAQS